MGDTKAGTFIGTDSYGNKFYENMADELPCTDLLQSQQTFRLAQL